LKHSHKAIIHQASAGAPGLATGLWDVEMWLFFKPLTHASLGSLMHNGNDYSSVQGQEQWSLGTQRGPMLTSWRAG
jgi:hypothetical protein